MSAVREFENLGAIIDEFHSTLLYGIPVYYVLAPADVHQTLVDMMA